MSNDPERSAEPERPAELPAETHVGRVALRVGSIADVLPFYRDALGFAVARDGDRARLLAGDDTLVVLEEAPGTPPRGPAEAGLFHLAVRVPDRPALGDVLDRLREAGVPLTGASDHLASEALYLDDPEGNGIEVYRDRPRDEWPWTEDGGVALDTLPLDLEVIAAEARGEAALPPGTDVGHVHLEVTDLPRSEAFYADDLGLRLRTRYGDAGTFLAAGDYHHHLGLNVWNRRTAPAGGGRGLAWFELVLPDHETAAGVADRLERAARPVSRRDGVLSVTDPDGIGLRLPVVE